ncbi:hypothetical protein BC829DRAFT_415060 [Chytridium lagenaria]|nr:hypothetical protein BC829DRAFT_415060 [Chytridium lagenaria]
MNPYVINQGPALVLHFDEAANTVRTQDPKDNQMTWTKEQLKQHCQNTILKVFNYLSSTSNYPERFIYALAGLMFRQTSPYPIGGKKAPGFRNFCGKTANDLLEWIATQIIIPPIMGRGHRLVEPGTCLRFCASKINEVIRWEIDRRKDDLDNAVLHGLSKTVILKEWRGFASCCRCNTVMAPSCSSFGSDEDGIQRRLLEAHAGMI